MIETIFSVGGWWIVFVIATQIAASKEAAFGRSLENCFKKYFDFDGTADQSEFWYFAIWALVTSFYFLAADNYTGVTEKITDVSVKTFWDAWILQTIADVILLFPSLAVGARRLHSVGKSGWWQLIMLTGIGLIVLIYWWAQPGGKSYSSHSKGTYRSKKDVSDELKELNKLYKDKALTKEEFSKAKKKLLD